MAWARTLSLLVGWAGIGLIVGLVFGALVGLTVFSAALALHILAQGAQMRRVARWAKDPSTAPPPGIGVFDDMLAPLYRHTRTQSRLLTDAHATLESMFAAAQALPDGAVTLNREFQIDWCNRVARDHLGLRLPADRGHNLLNLVRSPEFALYAHQDAWPEPALIRMPHHGEERVLMVQLTAYYGEQRLLVTRDVTQIEKLETTRRDFVANVSHELRTPLTVLAGFLETLRDLPPEAFSPEQRTQYIELMHEQAQRMQAIVADLLTLASLEATPSADAQPVPMVPVIESARQQIEALSAGRHHFDWHIDDTLDLLGAESELSSAVSNLLTNAVRYTPDGGQISVQWHRTAEGGASYSVRDTGIGIAKRHLPRLTERFYRVDRGRSRAVGGTGLGLAITRHIALRHDAELRVQSEPGHGSVFTLAFPPDRVADD